MTTTRQDVGTNPSIPFVEGDDRTIEIRVTRGQGLPGTPAPPFDLAGATVRWGMFAWPGGEGAGLPATNAAVTKSTGGGGIEVTDAPGGVLRIRLAPADTIGRAGRWWHETKIVDAAGEVATTTTGALLVMPRRLV